MLSLPLITPRDSHTLWYSPSHSYRNEPSTRSPNQQQQQQSQQNSNNELRNLNRRTQASSNPNSLAALLVEERALRTRKQNIASFGYGWIKPAGCAKTMLGVREEEAEREEGDAAAAEAEAQGMEGEEEDDDDDGVDFTGGQDTERDLDEDIPDGGGLVEEGDEGLEGDGGEEDEEDGMMERDLDDDIPDGFDGMDGDDDDFDEQPDLDDDIPAAEEGDSEMMGRDLDDDVPSAEEEVEEEEEWQHTDTDADDEDDDDTGLYTTQNFSPEQQRRQHPRPSDLPPPPPPQHARHRETEAQRLFLQRWSGGGDIDTDAVLESSGMALDDDDEEVNEFGASIGNNQSGPSANASPVVPGESSARRRRSAYIGRRRVSRRLRGGPRDSLE